MGGTMEQRVVGEASGREGFRFGISPLFFVRHGVTDHNMARLIMGQRDVPLNDTGRRQAERAAEQLANLALGSIVSSPLVRALETAEIIAAQLGGLPVVTVDGLKERAWGTLEGRNNRERPRNGTVPPGAESPVAFASRTLAALTAVSGDVPLLIVAHSGTCRVLRRHFAIDDGEGPVPNGVPYAYEPLPGGGWSERALHPVHLMKRPSFRA